MDFVTGNVVEINDTNDYVDDYVTANLYGHVGGHIVGIRYYSGLVNNKEMVSLVREPQNPYDRNAVRVNNIMGQQVGHIKREMAKALAEVVDQGLASVEGLVPYGADNVYKIAIDISFWGAPENKDRVSRIMRKHGYILTTELPGAKGKKSKSSQQRYDGSTGRSYRISSSQMKNELDGLFEKLKDVDQTSEEEACLAIQSVLYPHQKQAVAWMRKKEEGGGLPPFWKEEQPSGKMTAKTNGKVIYSNSVSNHITTEKPKAVKGGILADDMGLGKTLITISLILGNSWNNKPIHSGKGSPVDTDTDSKTDKSVSINLTSEPKKIRIYDPQKKKTIIVDLVSDPNKKKIPIVDLVSDDEEVSKEEKDTKKENNPIEDMNMATETAPTVEKEKVTESVTNVVQASSLSEENGTNRRPRRKTKRPAKYTEEPAVFDLEEEQPKKPKKANSKKAQKKSQEQDEDYNPSQEIAMMETQEEIKVPSKTHLCFNREPVPNNQASATLIVCPLSLISNWVGQVEEHVHEGAEVKILVFHGPAKKQVTGKVLREQDIVITTYQTLVQELKRSTNTLLFQMNWLRVVLDEGHIIRNLRSQQSTACCALKAERKWVLSGTPIQNSIKDLFPIVAFLRIGTFASEGEGWWMRTVVRPISNGDTSALERVRCLLGLICMRRTKSQKVNGMPIISMPQKDIFIQSIELSTKEREMYDKMNAASKRMMMSYMESSSQPTQYADMLVYIMRLRQICCHPSLAKEAVQALLAGNILTEKAKELATKLLCMIEAGSLDDCCICLDSITTPVISRCSHVFCKACIMGVVATNGQNYLEPRCPLCRSVLKTEDLVEPPTESEDSDQDVDQKTQASSKIHSLMHQLLKLDKENPTVKSLVVSQFTEFLKIIETHLIGSSIPYVLYHGGMTRKARENAIWQLQNGQAKVMLMTLKAGGVGLNLTAASQVFMMEPSWNPAAEDQCFDRVYRLGQTRPVRIMRFICKNTVEERMAEMQLRKRAIAKASLQQRTAADRKQQTMTDMKALMGI